MKVKMPKNFQVAQNLMQSNGNPEKIVNQIMGNMNSEQKQELLSKAKQYGCPDNILAQLQNIK